MWPENGAAPVILSRATISNANAEMRRLRAEVLDSYSPAQQGGVSERPADYTLRVSCLKCDLTLESLSGITGRNLTQTEYVEDWEICNQLGGSEANRIATLPSNSSLRLVPWAGVAALVGSTRQSDAIIHALSGAAYCFLSLPVSTGLPVHVNGFFELSSNRRDVWQAGADMTGDGRTRAEWNAALMRSTIAPSYLRLLRKLKQRLGYSVQYQSAWPTLEGVGAPWLHVVHTVLQLCMTEPLLFACYDNVAHLSIQPDTNSMVLASEGSQVAPLTLDLASMSTRFASLFGSSQEAPNPNKVVKAAGADVKRSEWVPCASVVLLPDPAIMAASGSSSDLSVIIGNFLLFCGCPYVECLPELNKTLRETKTCANIVTPTFIRGILRSHGEATQRFVASLQGLASVFFEFVLSYCLSDLGLDRLGHSHIKGAPPQLDMKALRQLDMLPILPLHSGQAGILHIFTPSAERDLQQLQAMGFSSLRAVNALIESGFSFDTALDRLASSSSQSIASSNSNAYMLCSEEEAQMLARGACKPYIIDRSSVAAKDLITLDLFSSQHFSNILALDGGTLNDLLQVLLPPACATGQVVTAEAIKAEVGEEGYASFVEFLVLLWRYFKDHPTLLSSLSQSYSVVPVKCDDGGVSFVPFSPKFNLISPAKASHLLPTEVTAILLRVTGLCVINCASIPLLANMPVEFWEVVHPPSRLGLLEALAKAGESIDALTSADKELLLNHLAACGSVHSLTTREITLFRGLPLFISGSDLDTFIRLSSPSPMPLRVLTTATIISSSLLPSHFVHHASPEQLALLTKLGVSPCSQAAFLREVLFPEAGRYYSTEPEVYIDTVAAMCKSLPALNLEDPQFVKALKDARFLPCGRAAHTSETSYGQLYKAGELFDPAEADLVRLLDAFFFPVESLCTADVLLCLRSLGLQVALEWPSIIACARSIAQQSASSEGATSSNIQRGAHLLQFLNKNIDRLMEANKPASTGGGFSLMRLKTLFGVQDSADVATKPAEYAQQLMNIAWLPVATQRIHAALPLHTDSPDAIAACPSQCRPRADAWLCSATYHIAANSYVSEGLSEVFGWNLPLTVQTIAVELRAVASTYADLAATEYDLVDIQQQLNAVVPQLYHKLDQLNGGDEIRQVRAVLNAAPWVWIGSAFVPTSRMARTVAINAAPYLYQLPQDLLAYRNLLAAVDIKATFTSRDYIEVLRTLAVETGAAQDAKEDLHIKPLTDAQLELAVALVTVISSEPAGIDNLAVYLPDSSGRLALSTEMVFDDVAWLSGPEYSHIRIGCRLVHVNISAHVAEKLGAKSLRLTMVSSSQDAALFTAGSDVRYEAFGQTESITNRLRTILDLYPDGSPVFSELIQNADDAGATVVRFLLDENTYE